MEGVILALFLAGVLTWFVYIGAAIRDELEGIRQALTRQDGDDGKT